MTPRAFVESVAAACEKAGKRMACVYLMGTLRNIDTDQRARAALVDLTEDECAALPEDIRSKVEEMIHGS